MKSKLVQQQFLEKKGSGILLYPINIPLHPINIQYSWIYWIE